MATTLGASDFLKPGQDYAFMFSGAADTPGDAIVQALAQYSYMTAVRNNFNGDNLIVGFTYAGDGSDSVGSAASDISSALSDNSVTYTFVSAAGNSISQLTSSGSNLQTDNSGVVDEVGQALSDFFDGVGAGIKKALPSTSGLWAVAIIGIVVVFVISGGPGIVRSVRA